MKKISMHPVALIFFVALIVLGIADLGAVLFGGVDSSLSHFIVTHSLGEKALPYFPPISLMLFTLGAVAGHLVFPMKVTTYLVQDISKERIKNAYYQATNIQRSHKEIINRMHQELNS